MPLESGTLLYDRYRIERILGQGGMGAVYLAHDDNLNLHCAVKENLNVSPESERQFKREATLLASLRHNNLPRVTNHFVLGSQQYLVMDYIEGEDLKERLQRETPLKEVDVVRWGSQICDALVYLHSLTPPVVHRDIKPGNIKLNAQGDAILVDFGIAKSSAAGSKTTTAAAAFTPGYAPPEQYGMGRTDPRTDQFALASTLYALLTNQTPPDSMERLLGNIDLVPPNKFRPELSATTNDVLLRGMALRPDDRFATIAEFKSALTGKTMMRPRLSEATIVASGADATKIAPKTPEETKVAERPKPETPAPARPAWIIPSVIAGVLVIVIGILVFAFVIAPMSSGGPTQTQAAIALANTEAAQTAQALSAITKVVTQAASPTPTTAPPTPTSTEPPSPTAPAGPATNTPQPPVLQLVNVSANTITAGDSVTLNWSFTGVDRVTISEVAGEFPAEGSVTLAPSETITYTITGTNTASGASVAARQTVVVTPRAVQSDFTGRVAFISNRDGKNYQIFTMNPDGTDVQQLTFDPIDKWSPTWRLGRLQQPVSGPLLAWNADGTQLLYSADAGTGSGVDLWVINADGSDRLNLTASQPGDAVGDNYQPVWCQSGDIAFTSTRVNNTPQIFMMRLEGERRRRNFSTTRSNPLEFDAAWFPNTCQRMFVVTTQNGVPEIWRIFPFRETYSSLWTTFPVLAKQSYRMYVSEKSSLNGWVYDPAVSPDGRYLAYTREAPDPEGQRIILAEITESGGASLVPQELTGSLPPRPRNRDHSASWSPDGKYLVFVSERDGQPQIYRMSFTGVEQTNLSDNEFNELSPVWYIPAEP